MGDKFNLKDENLFEWIVDEIKKDELSDETLGKFFEACYVIERVDEILKTISKIKNGNVSDGNFANYWDENVRISYLEYVHELLKKRGELSDDEDDGIVETENEESDEANEDSSRELLRNQIAIQMLPYIYLANAEKVVTNGEMIGAARKIADDFIKSIGK